MSNVDDDDLDELLDEVEKKFCRNVSVASAAHAHGDGTARHGSDRAGRRAHGASKAAEPASSLTDDLDALLEELQEEDLDPPLKTEQPPRAAAGERKLPAQPAGRKCCPVFVGGSAVTNGVGTATSKRSCDRLRCTSCDFQVLTFNDCEWDSSCDYLFLRNNMPDRQKLRAKLRPSRGVRAYACQCSWFSTLEPTDLRDRAGLRWVCGKHQD